MIKQVLPSKKAPYKCKIWPNEDSIIIKDSWFGSYTGSSVDHILEVLSYPPTKVVVDGKDALMQAIEWVKTNQHCVKKISFFRSENLENMLDFVHSFIEFDVRLKFGCSLIITCTKEELRIERPGTPIWFFWRLKCRKIRFIDEDCPFAEIFMLYFAPSDIPESLMIEQVIFELMKERQEIWWAPILRYCKKCEEEWQHPIYGKVNECCKIYHEGRKFTFFGAHHDGKKLLVVDIEHNAPDTPVSGLVI
ncbi:hypothetical protein CAEBREN_00909 [Caenorhabditis brenneri]|uniref:F-box associated domain-containing protein n=1 Tax=Caenorhabditis brenneri TaxID=135651 RepID=G0NVP2_CAEBE|nr:hypothetical protein CAEBREN_00909 [Caenorhabditis brenneri]